LFAAKGDLASQVSNQFYDRTKDFSILSSGSILYVMTYILGVNLSDLKP